VAHSPEFDLIHYLSFANRIKAKLRAGTDLPEVAGAWRLFLQL
jgi:hypothetical protein